MKNIYLFCMMFFVSSTMFAGDIPKLELTKNGFEPIVYTVEGKTAEELYNRVKEWVQVTYEKPDRVVKADIPNKYLRIEGVTSDTWVYKPLGMANHYTTSYVLELDFKDGKYRLSLFIDRFFTGGKRVAFTLKDFYKKDGSLRSAFVEGKEKLNLIMNVFTADIYKYISGNIDRNEDW